MYKITKLDIKKIKFLMFVMWEQGKQVEKFQWTERIIKH